MPQEPFHSLHALPVIAVSLQSVNALEHDLASRESLSKTARKPEKQSQSQFDRFDFKQPTTEEVRIHTKIRSNSVNDALRPTTKPQAKPAVTAINRIALNLRVDSPQSTILSTLSPQLSTPPTPLTAFLRSPLKVSPVKSTVDYSDFFDNDIKEYPGTYQFIIQSLRPEQLQDSSNAILCIADCYIILHTSKTQSDTLAFRIHTWIGKESELDKRFCAALFSVGLRDWIGQACKIERESQDEESVEFVALFEEFGTRGVSFQTESGLYTVAKKRYPLRLYEVIGKTGIVLQIVEPVVSSLTSASVFLVDFGMELIQWNGQMSTLNHRSKCRMLVQRINKSERQARSNIVEIDENEETERFWEILNQSTSTPRPSFAQPAQQDSDSSSMESTSSSSFDSLSNSSPDLPRLSFSTSAVFDNQPNPLIIPDLYTITETYFTDHTKHLIHVDQKLKQSLLTSDRCYILDVTNEIFMWIGSKSTAQAKQSTTELLTQILVAKPRSRWLALHRVFEGVEPEIFKIRFVDWDRFADISLKQDQKADTKEDKRTAQKIKVNADALYAPPVDLSVDTKLLDSAIKHANAELESMSCFIFRKNAFVKLSEDEAGHFHVDDSYVFLCLYRPRENAEAIAEPSNKLTSSFASFLNAFTPQQVPSRPVSAISVASIESVDSDTTSKLEAIVYFWSGSKSSKLAYSTFKLKTEADMQELMSSMYACTFRTIVLENGREPVAFLAHIHNTIVLHKKSKYSSTQPKTRKLQSRPLSQKPISFNLHIAKPSVMYQLWIDDKFKTTRAVQVDAVATVLATRDCFLVINLEAVSHHYLWIGKGISKTELRRVQETIPDILRYVFKYHQVVVSTLPVSDIALCIKSETDDPYLLYAAVQEGFESDEFWMMLTSGKAAYAPGLQFYYCLTPRFLRCSCSEGYFEVEEVLFHIQSDLRDDTCTIFDTGYPNQLYIWVGSEATELVRMLTRKCAQVWFENLDNGRSIPEAADIISTSKRASSSYNSIKTKRVPPRPDGDAIWIYQGNEPLEFKAYFRAWNSATTAVTPDARNTYLGIASSGQSLNT